jgi:hypothetical protein
MNWLGFSTGAKPNSNLILRRLMASTAKTTEFSIKHVME